MKADSGFELTSYSTAEIVANSPRFRRKSSIFVDAIHDLPEKADLAPAQLYSTESGRLFHSGRIVIITVGLPARGKTYDTSYISNTTQWTKLTFMTDISQ